MQTSFRKKQFRRFFGFRESSSKCQGVCLYINFVIMLRNGYKTAIFPVLFMGILCCRKEYPKYKLIFISPFFLYTIRLIAKKWKWNKFFVNRICCLVIFIHLK